MIKKILVVDDNRGIRESIRLLLELEGMDVFTNSGIDINADIVNKHPDIILLDIRLDGQDGRKICQTIKSHFGIQSPKIILMTAGIGMKASIQESCADGFIEKPFNIDILIQTIHTL